MNAILKTIDAICDAAAALAGVLLIALFVLGMAELISRDLFDTSLSFSVEYSGYFLAAVLLLASGWTMRQGGHIRVNLLGARIGPKVARGLDIACTVLGLIVCGFMAWALLDFAVGTLARGTLTYFPSATPIGYPQFLVALGPSVLELALVARLIRLITGAAPDLGAGAKD
ncbi:MAG: TRAP transporter small permease [Alphaproteobacteria bacterium]|nr:TRAP transporter small permease [Alphaproteobacteria bacterium]